MSRFFFDVSGSVQSRDNTGREVTSSSELSRQALLEAASASALNGQRGEETAVMVTVRDLTGAVHLKIHLVSQIEYPQCDRQISPPETMTSEI